MPVVEMIQVKALIGKRHQYAPVGDKIIEIGGDPNTMVADDDDSKTDSSDQQNVQDGEHVPSNNEVAYNIRSLAHNIKGKLEGAPASDFVAKPCIFRIIEPFRKINDLAYTPVEVSIGPFHRGKQSLQAMETCKLIFMRDMLSRSIAKTGLCWSTMLEECVQHIKSIEEEARSCYSEPIDLSSDEFVEMMVVDGLFIIELFRRSACEVIYNHDPIFSSTWHNSNLIRDMALLENQLPMLVLDCLFNLPSLHEELKDSSITPLALKFFNSAFPSYGRVLDQHSNCEGKHLLDLLAKTLHQRMPRPANESPAVWNFIPTATELKDAGVEFKKSSIEGSFLDIKFNVGVLEIPPIIVAEKTDSMLKNLIASELCSDEDIYYFTSYASFMDDLVKSGNDVGLLRKQGIIINDLGSDEYVSKLDNKLCHEVILGHTYYTELYDQVNTYYRKRRHVWRATLKRDYFNSPWAVISVAAAILLLVLTLTATIFSLLSFFLHKS